MGPTVPALDPTEVELDTNRARLSRPSLHEVGGDDPDPDEVVIEHIGCTRVELDLLGVSDKLQGAAAAAE